MVDDDYTDDGSAEETGAIVAGLMNVHLFRWVALVVAAVGVLFLLI